MNAEAVRIRAGLSQRQAEYAELLAKGVSWREAGKQVGYKIRPPKPEHPRIARYLKALVGSSEVETPPVELVNIAPASEVLELAAEIARDRTKADRDRLVAIKLLGMFHNLWSDNSDSGGKSESIEYHFHIGDKEPEPEPITVNAE